MRIVCLGLLAGLLVPPAATAQPLFVNPFAEPALYQQLRGPSGPATHRYRYEVTTSVGSGQPRVEQVAIDVAPDWSRLTAGDSDSLYDFRLNRIFRLHGDTFESLNGAALPFVRVYERQNRTVIGKIIDGPGVKAGKDCDADAELAVSLTPSSAPLRLAEKAGAVSLVCDGRPISSFTRGVDGPAPAALWPTLNAVAPVHPALFRRMKATAAAPANLENTPGGAAQGAELRSRWRLVSAERTNAAYPLNTGMRNTTAALVDGKIGSGLGAVATEAVAGRAAGGPPTAASWAGELRRVYDREGAPGVGMLLLPTANMFPQAFERCDQGDTGMFCQAVSTGRSAIQQEAGPRSMLAIALAEGGGAPTKADMSDRIIANMQIAQASPQRGHPALGAAYALALKGFSPAAVEKARAAGLPTDAGALQAAALKALPYNAAYWLDVADGFVGGYDFQTMLLFYDVAMSLPMPEAQASPLLVGKRSVVERVRRDFPDAFLTLAP